MSNLGKKFVISLICHDLNGFEKINLSIIVSEQIGDKWVEIKKVEILYNQNNPQFSNQVAINYEFENIFDVRFDIYGSDKQQIKIGYAIVNIVELLTAKNRIHTADIILENIVVGKITIMGEYQMQKNDSIELTIKPNNLVLKQWCFCKIPPRRPFLRISRQISDMNQTVQMFQSACIQYPTETSWPTIKVLSRNFCNNDHDNVLKIEVFEQSDRNQFQIGQINASINEMENLEISRQLVNINGDQKIGGLRLKCKLTPCATFEEFIDGGLELNMMISIDFTASNGHYKEDGSLHYFDKRKRVISEYETALKQISQILIQYDHDKKIPLYGFGFLLNDQIQHCYPLNHNTTNPEVCGLKGIFETYRDFVPEIEFSGPTNFAPTIRLAKSMAEQFKKNGSKNYLVLTILTDGQLVDQEQASGLIQNCSNLPISIIIIGVGRGSFLITEKLTNFTQTTRAIMKFVEFRKFQQDFKKFTREVLSELPDQVSQYMLSINKVPSENQFEKNIEILQQYLQSYEQNPLSFSKQLQKLNQLFDGEENSQERVTIEVDQSPNMFQRLESQVEERVLLNQQK